MVQPLLLTPREFVELLEDPAAGELVSAAGGAGIVVVDIGDPAAADRVAALGPGAGLPAVLVARLGDPGLASACRFADIVLDDTGDAEHRLLDSITTSVAACPVASLTLALLLRGTPAVGDPDAGVAVDLAAESAAYSTLLAGSEFAAWRAARPRRSTQEGPERVRVERTGDELTVTLARPARRNALDAAMRDQLVDALTIGAVDPSLRIRLRGEGPDFCAGGDLDEFGTQRDPAYGHALRLTRSPALLLHRVRDRSTVELHGACLGSGIELAAFAGQVVAAPDTIVGLPEVSMGLIPGAGGTVSLPRRIGRHRTALLALSGRRIDAETSLRWGLADDVRW